MLILSAGFVNRIFICRNSKLMKQDNVSVKESDVACIIRLYGGKFIQADNQLRSNGRECEILVVYILGELSIGPKLYGIFDTGRLEQFLPNYTILTDDDVESNVTMAALARKYAQMHSLSLPISKEPRDFFTFIEETLKSQFDSYKEGILSRKPDTKSESDEDKKILQAYDVFEKFDYFEFLNEMKQLAPRIHSKVVVSHNDTNRANVMIDRSVETVTKDSIRLVDFEFSGYNYRGSDIGSHFNNRRVDMAKVVEGKFEKHLPYPDRVKREHFIQQYLDELNQLGVELGATTDTVEHILLESEFYGNLSHFIFFAFMVSDHQRWKDLPADYDVGSFNPVCMLAADILDFISRKEETMKMLHELSL